MKELKEFEENGYYFLKCGCGIFATDYLFISECCKCGFKFSGSKEAIDKWGKEGILMELLNPREIPAKKRVELIDLQYIQDEDALYDELYNFDDYNDIRDY